MRRVSRGQGTGGRSRQGHKSQPSGRQTLLDTYVGPHAGERILAGQIRRGDIEEIHAAIWLSDMRGFTAWTDSIPPRPLIDLLNRYFDCQVPAILDHGGEVLKFMGDGLLAIFPIAGGDANAAEACRRALATARAAQTNVEALAEPAGIEHFDGVGFRLALHLGDVLYGNIGSGNRFDFTCIGQAVNLAARMGTAAQKPRVSAAFRALRGYRRGSCTIPPDGSALLLLRLARPSTRGVGARRRYIPTAPAGRSKRSIVRMRR